jgi:hypothetical protein
MRFLADENFPGNVAIPLELEGHDVFGFVFGRPAPKMRIFFRAHRPKKESC